MGDHLLWRCQDNVVELDALIPIFKNLSPGEIASLARQPLLPLEVEGDRQYVISLRQGLLKEPRLLKQLLSGEHVNLAESVGKPSSGTE
jgi:hypothetical protein